MLPLTTATLVVTAPPLAPADAVASVLTAAKAPPLTEASITNWVSSVEPSIQFKATWVFESTTPVSVFGAAGGPITMRALELTNSELAPVEFTAATR